MLVLICLYFMLLPDTNEKIESCVSALCWIFNIHVSYYGLENYDDKQKKIIIANHTSYYDALIVFTKIKCGAVYSSSIKNPIMNKITAIIPSLCINRGEKNNTVEKINDFVDKHNSIILYPQAIFSSIDTITQFKSGAFTTKYPVQPIIIRYKQDISSISYWKMLLLDRLDVEVYVEKIINRCNMSIKEYVNVAYDIYAKYGFKISNVSSSDVHDSVK